MRIILTQDVPHLGSLGDEVTVKNGYARNFLLPQGMAISSGNKSAAHLAHRRTRLEILRAEAVEVAKVEGEKVAGLELTVSAKAGINGRLFGSVTNRDIQAALAEKGYELDRRSIQLHAPIKNVGTFTATVRIHSEVKTEISVTVVPIALSDEERAAQAPRADAEGGEAAASPAEGGEAAEGAADQAEASASPGEGAEAPAAPKTTPETTSEPAPAAEASAEAAE